MKESDYHLFTFIMVAAILLLAIFNALHIQISTGFSFGKRRKRKKWEQSKKQIFVSNIIDAASTLSLAKTGAIITFERNNSLGNWIGLGHKIDSVVTTEILVSIFNKESPTHDGAVIIKNDRIACCSTYYPMSQEKLPIKYGSRHRASLEISVLTDSLSLIVSEETGKVSYTFNGKIKEATLPEVSKLLMKEI